MIKSKIIDISENLSDAESLFDIVELFFEILFCKISMVK